VTRMILLQDWEGPNGLVTSLSPHNKGGDVAHFLRPDVIYTVQIL
jgi:hypothetical protein